MTEKLRDYRAKRDFSKTAEPAGSAKSSGGPVSSFVVQKHHARRLHYDFRLEIDGVLVSFAVPKGLSCEPGEKRLAVRTEDHPLEYAAFEGTIPQGEYGAGWVIVWDRGTFENLTEKKGVPLSAAQGVEEGHLKIRLHGDKLQGVFAMARMAGSRFGEPGKENWLVFRTRDESGEAEACALDDEASVISGLTLDDLEGRGEA